MGWGWAGHGIGEGVEVVDSGGQHFGGEERPKHLPKSEQRKLLRNKLDNLFRTISYVWSYQDSLVQSKASKKIIKIERF